VSVDEMVVQVEEGGGDGEDVLTTTQIRREPTQWRAAVYARLGTCAKMVGEVQQHEMLKFAEVEKRLKKIEHLCRSLTTARPLHMVRTQRGTPIRVGALAQVDDSQKPAVLHRNPKTLGVLWDEWMNG
jgi:hypothetical protein